MRKPRTKTKLKSRRAAVKRFKLTATGKVKRSQSMKQHILTKKTRNRKRRLRQGELVSASETASVRSMLLS